MICAIERWLCIFSNENILFRTFPRDCRVLSPRGIASSVSIPRIDIRVDISRAVRKLNEKRPRERVKEKVGKYRIEESGEGVTKNKGE